MFTFEIEKLKLLVKIAAKEELLSDFGHSTFECKDDGSVITPADLAMQDRLEKELKQFWPQYELLGEEMTEAEQQKVIDKDEADEIEGYWCVDPLDGTSNYAAGLPFFAVSIALIINRQQQLGLIYDPIRDEMFTAIKGQGAYLNDQLLHYSGLHSCQKFTGGEPAKNKPVMAEIDIKRLPEKLAIKLVAENFCASQRNIGSSAIDWCWMSAGRFDIYLHGGQKMWDYAAGSLIFSEAGGHSISLDGQSVFNGRLEVRSALASFDKNLFNDWCDWIGIGLVNK
ncbi:MAG: inositol monophosphatase family protein [Gammaproteobacteria bacterium]|nr:inositol monophosphatase family protein [Gammaproteobacteria bacterium]